MSQNAVATAADYADALLTVRRAKTGVTFLLLLVLLTQLTLFCVVHFGHYLDPVVVDTAASPATLPGNVPTDLAVLALHYLVGVTSMAGIGLILVLSAVLLLIVNIMLVGRLIGISRLITALVWCVVLIVLLFPWQAFLNWSDMAGATFRLPGVLYSWAELVENPKFIDLNMSQLVLKWARFAGFPIVAVLILLRIHFASKRGLRLALGEADIRSDASAVL